MLPTTTTTTTTIATTSYHTCMWHLKKNEEKLLLIAAQTIFLQSLLLFFTVFPKNFVIFFTNTNSWKLSKLCAMQTMPQHNAIHRIIYCPQPPFHHPSHIPLIINCHALPQERIQLLVCQVRQFLSAFYPDIVYRHRQSRRRMCKLFQELAETRAICEWMSE